jgi:hypothetical protein
MFAFKTADSSWEPLTKINWLKRCNQIWISASFKPHTAHSFCIGGCTELLLRGIQPDIVCIQGRWKLKTFLEYWFIIQFVLPIFISKSFSCTHASLINSSMIHFSSKYTLSFVSCIIYLLHNLKMTACVLEESESWFPPVISLESTYRFLTLKNSWSLHNTAYGLILSLPTTDCIRNNKHN